MWSGRVGESCESKVKNKKYPLPLSLDEDAYKPATTVAEVNAIRKGNKHKHKQTSSITNHEKFDNVTDRDTNATENLNSNSIVWGIHVRQGDVVAQKERYLNRPAYAFDTYFQVIWL